MLIRRIFTPSDIQRINQLNQGEIVEQEDILFSTNVSIDSSVDNTVNISADNYLSKLIKLIPSESIALFVFIDNIIKGTLLTDNPLPESFYWLVFLAQIFLAIFLIWKTSSSRNFSIPYKQIIISTIAFIVWVFALGGPFSLQEWYRPELASILLGFYTVLAPKLY